MIHYRSPFRNRRRRGSVAPLTALLSVPLLTVMAIAIDGGALMMNRRQAQGAADAAALAAAIDLFNNYPKKGGYDVSGTAVKSALTTAKANGFNNDGISNTVQVRVSPSAISPAKYLQGQFAGQSIPAGYAEVVITFNQDRYFSGVIGSGTLQVPAHAVARGQWIGAGAGILLLDPTGSPALSAVGNGTVVVTGGGSVVINSSDSGAASLKGNATVQASVININGGYSTTGNAQFVGTINTGVPPTPDPLAALPVPPVQPNPSIGYTITNGIKVPYPVLPTGVSYNGSDPLYLYAGTYQKGISLSGNGNVTFLPDPSTGSSIVYLQGGGLSVTGNGSLTANGITIYNAPASSSDTIVIHGNGSVTITPPDSGPTTGMAIFQDRTSTNPITVTGNGSTNIEGTFYAAKATLSLKGNGGLDGSGNPLDTIGTQFVAYDMSLVGNGSFNINYQGQKATPIRIIQLVE